MDNAFMARLEHLRTRIDRPLPLTSAYRCPAHHASVSKTGAAGPHTTGRAADVRVAGESAVELVKLALELGFTGLGLKQAGPVQGRFVHLDDLEAPGYPRPRIWTY
jgi:uncharacterized protein YcbK (DUF882 family)